MTAFWNFVHVAFPNLHQNGKLVDGAVETEAGQVADGAVTLGEEVEAAEKPDASMCFLSAVV